MKNDREMEAYNAIKEIESLFNKYMPASDNSLDKFHKRHHLISFDDVPSDLLNSPTEKILSFILGEKKYDYFEGKNIKVIRDSRLIKDYLVSIDITDGTGLTHISIKKAESHAKTPELSYDISGKDIHCEVRKITFKLAKLLNEHGMFKEEYFSNEYICDYTPNKKLSTKTSMPEISRSSSGNKLEKLGIKHVYENSGKRNVTVVWNDNSSTSSTCSEEDEYDFSVGLAMCIAKHEFLNYQKFAENLKKRKKYYSAVKSKTKESK